MADISVRVKAVGLQQSITQQAQAAQRTVSRLNLTPRMDAKGLQQPLGRITGNLSEFNKSLDASTARVFAFGATVSVINGIADAFKGVVSAVIEVERALENINVVMGLTTAQLADYSDALFDVAKNTSQTFQTVATAATEFARQGLSAEETLQRVNDALILTRLSGLGAEQSVASLTAVVNGFARESLNTTEIVNRLANVDASFAVSSKDLADALARAGATAQSAGVNFNELLAVVTSVQQQTARGGSVIGNAFKSIFTRIQRAKVRETLEGVGVATTDAFGNFRSAIAILKDYASVYGTLSDAQKAYTAEQIAGVFQVNNLKALINDLSGDFSIYEQALGTAAATTDEATRRNEQLNQTFAALGAQAGESIRQLADSFGELTLEPAMERVLGMVQTIVDALSGMLGEKDGDNLMGKFFKGMGAFISGPGLALISAAFLKLFMLVGKHATAAIREMFKISSEAQRQKGLQEAILQILIKDEQAYTKILAASGNQNKQAKILVGIIKQANAEYAKQQALLSNLSKSGAMKGFGVGKSGYIQPISRKAEGHTPTMAGGGMPEVQAAEDAGYASPVKPQQVRQMNVPNLGKVMYNTQEKIVNVPNLAQPFIVPPASSKAYPNYASQVKEQFGEPMAKNVLGRAFTPKQRAFAEGFSPIKKGSLMLEKEYASNASGLVPNFIVKPAQLQQELIKQGSLRKGDILDNKKTYEYKFSDGTSVLGKPGELRGAVTMNNGKLVKNENSLFFKDRSINPASRKSLDQSSRVSMLLPEATAGDAATRVATQISGGTLTETLGKPGALTEIVGPGTIKKLGGEQSAKTKLQTAFSNDVFDVKFSKSGVQDLENQTSLREKIDSDLSSKVTQVLTGNAKQLISKSNLKNVPINQAEVKGQAEKLVGANSKMTGTMFEDIVTIAVGKSNEFSSQDHYRNWDFQGVGALNNLFDKRVNEFADTKRSDLPHARASMAKKILFGTPLGKQTLKSAAQQALPTQRAAKAKTRASGLVPNLGRLDGQQEFFRNAGKKMGGRNPRAKIFDVDDTLMDTSVAMKKMGIKPGDQRIYGDKNVSRDIARQAKPTLLGEKVKALKNKDNVFLLTDAGPARNQVLSEKFDIPLKKIIALRDPAQISKFGLDSVVPSAQGLRRQKKDPSYKLEKGSRDYRALKTPEKKKKVIDQFKKAGVNPTLYDDKLDIVAEAGRHGKLMRFASPLAAKGMVPNFVPPQRRLATTQRTALATKGAGSFDDFVSQKIIGKTYKEIERWGGGVSMGIMNRTRVGNMTEGAVKGLQQFNQKYLNLTNPLMGPLGPGKLPRVYDSPGFAIKHDKATFTKLEAERLQLQRSKITDAKKSREDNPNASPEELKELRRAIIKKKDVEIAAKNKEIG